MANDIRISELNEITVNSNINEIVINNRESVADAGVTKKIQVANLLTDSIINTNNLANSSVTTDKIADKSISADKIADKTITNSQIANYTIGNNELATNSVDNRVLDNDESFVAGGYTATRSILSPKVEASDRLTVTSGLVDLNQITYTFPATQAPRRFLRTDGSGNLTWEEAVPGDGTALVFDNISPVGTVIPYAGNASSVPNDKWLNLFADRRFLGAAYPELRDLLDTTWGPRTDAGGAESPTGPYYALPDLKVAALSAGEVSDIIKGTAFEPAQVGVYNSAHNLGTVPDVFGATAICTTAEYGWQVGDEIIINTQVDGSHTSNNGAPTTVYADDTNVYFRTTSKASGYWVGEIATADGSGTNGEARLTVGNWDVVLWWYDNTIDSAMSYIIKAKPDDIQQYDVVTGPGLSAIDALGVQSPTITLSSSEIGLKVSEDFTFDGSNRLKLTGTQVYATVEHDPITDTTYLRNCTLTRTDIGRFTITVDDIGTRPTAVGSLANNWTLISSRNSAFEGQYAISVRTDNNNTSIFVEIVELDAVKAHGGGNDNNTVSEYSRSYADVPFQVLIAN